MVLLSRCRCNHNLKWSPRSQRLRGGGDDEPILGRSGAEAVEEVADGVDVEAAGMNSFIGDSAPLGENDSAKIGDFNVTLDASQGLGAVIVSDDQRLKLAVAPTGISSTERVGDAVIYHRDDSADVVAHVLSSGDVQMLGVLEEGQNVVEYSLGGVEGVDWRPQEDGGADLVRGSEIVATVAAPWAIDADGISLETWYEYDNGIITQRVNTEGARYPVISDPKVGFGNGVYFYFNRIESTGIVTLSAAVASVGVIATCEKLVAVAGRVPVAKSFVGYACGKVGVGPLVSFFRNLPNVMRSTPSCTEVRFGGTGSHRAKVVPSSYCQPDNKSWRF